MDKTYRMKTGKLILCFLFMGALLIFFSWQLFVNYSKLNIFEVILYPAGIVSGIAGILISLTIKYTVTLEGIKAEASKILYSKREIRWEDLRVIEGIPNGFGFRTYYLNPDAPSKQRINIGSSIKDSRELITEIVERAPHAYIDDEVKKIIAEYKESLVDKK